MDAFQDCYKFEPYDCRYWAAFYLFLRIAVLTIFAFAQSVFFVVVCGILLIPAIVMTAIVRPYRKSVYNVIDLVFFLVFIHICFSTTGIALLTPDQSFLFGIGVIIPFAYIILLAVYKILPNFCIVRIKELALHLLCLHQSSIQRRDRWSSQLHYIENTTNWYQLLATFIYYIVWFVNYVNIVQIVNRI